MAALPKINIDAILKLPLSKRVLILAGVNVLIAFLVYWFLTGPKYTEVQNLLAQMKDLNAKLAENRQIAADIPKFLHDKEVLEEKLKAAVAQLPNEKEIPDLIDSISNAGEKSGLKIVVFKPESELKKGFYAEVPVSMQVEGRFESLYDFSAKVGNLPRIVNINSMDISSQGYNNRIPIIKANFITTTFRFIPGTGEGDQKDNVKKN